MSRVSRSRGMLAAAAFVIGSASAAGAQATATRPTPAPPAAVAVPVIIQPPAAVIPPRRAPAVRANTSTAALATPALAPVRSARPDSAGPPARIALVTPTPLTRPAPTRRNRDFGAVRNDVARQVAPAGATGRCKDGTYLTVPATEEACVGKDGLAMREPRARTAPPAPPRRP